MSDKAAPPAFEVTDPNYKAPPGRLGNLTPQQQEILDKFREEIQKEGWFVPERMDDAMLLRFVSMPRLREIALAGCPHDRI